MQLNIAIPAWGPYHVDLACRFTVPALLASLAQSGFHEVTFFVHTYDESSFREAIGEHPIRFFPLRPLPPRPPRAGSLPNEYWAAFKQAHKEALAATKPGQVAALFNSDTVVSRECFGYVGQQLSAGKKVVASVGIRTQIEDNDGPPIEASAPDLFRWIWGHRHPITEECIWDGGRSHHPTILFFETGADVSMHCFHLTPMFILVDRDLRFHGTIDDDLLGAYRDGEVAYPAAGEFAIAELSPTWKTHPFGTPLSVSGVADFWRRRALHPHYRRNFQQRLAVLGAPAANHPAADAIIAQFGGRAAPSNLPVMGNQDPAEFASFLDFVRARRVRKYLEIGCRNGESFGGVMRAIGAGARGVAVDLPENSNARAKLLDTVASLRSAGMGVELIFGDSGSQAVIEAVRAAGPFDLILIDADHRYEGVRRDFETYADLAPLVALHDVDAPPGHMSDGHPNGVGVFWREIRGLRRFVEFITPGSKMGFGIVLRGEPLSAGRSC